MPAKNNSKPDLDAILDAMIYLYAESRRVTRAIAEEHGLTGSQLWVLKMIEPAGRLSLSELSDRTRAKNSTMTGIVDRMERDGLVVRRRSDDDRRVVNIELTGKGRTLASGVDSPPTHLFRSLLESLPERDAAELERIMTKLAKRVKEMMPDRANGAP